MAALRGGAIGVPTFSSRPTGISKAVAPSSLALSLGGFASLEDRSRCIICLAVQESSSPTVATEKKADEAAKKEATTAKASAAKAKAALKPLPEMMEEEIIPSLRSILEAQIDITDVELCFQDNKLEGSFLKEGNGYSFWAFFTDGSLAGPKGFSLSSYSLGASTVEPFLVDEKKPTAKHVVFWVEKRLAAQGIIPVWQE